jgi:hypothetical protein
MIYSYRLMNDKISQGSQFPWHAVLASRLEGLGALRQRIWETARQGGTPVWVSEIDARDRFAGKDLATSRSPVSSTCARRPSSSA